MKILWEKSMEIGIHDIDEQHHKFVDTINDFFGIFKSPYLDKDMEHVLSELDEYATFHFGTEEKYFDQFGYEGAEEHKQAHREFKEKVERFKKQFRAGSKSAAIELVDFLEDWLIDHLGEMDRKYVQCFKANGLK